MSDDQTAYQAARESAALFDLTGRTQIELTGGDRIKFLHNFCTNDIKRLGEGEGCEAFITNIKGRVLGHVFVFASADALWIDSVPDAGETLLPHLDRYLITEDVTITPRTEEFGELLVSGPQSTEMLTKCGFDLNDLSMNGQRFCGEENACVALRRVDWLNAPGYLLLARRAGIADLQQELTAAGACAASAEVFDALRIESGFPLYGLDVTEENIAQEVGRTQQAISFTKGCYLGQEPIARLDAMGHVNRRLCTLKLSQGPPPGAGADVAVEVAGESVGRITSAAISPADGLPVAMALLRSRYLAPATNVFVHVGEHWIPANVTNVEFT